MEVRRGDGRSLLLDASTDIEVVVRQSVFDACGFARRNLDGLHDLADLVAVDRDLTLEAHNVLVLGRTDRDLADRLFVEVTLGNDELDRARRIASANRDFEPSCGRVKRDLKLSERVYSCECGYTAERDYNAALNLRDTERYKIA